MSYTPTIFVSHIDLKNLIGTELELSQNDIYFDTNEDYAKSVVREAMHREIPSFTLKNVPVIIIEVGTTEKNKEVRSLLHTLNVDFATDY